MNKFIKKVLDDVEVGEFINDNKNDDGSVEGVDGILEDLYGDEYIEFSDINDGDVDSLLVELNKKYNVKIEG